MISFLFSIIFTLIIVLVAIAFYTLIERKILGYVQLRKGPNKVIITGIPQPFADAIKLFLKESSKPQLINTSVFMLSPSITLILALLFWSLYPHSHPTTFLSFGILYFLCVSRINVYTVFIRGWSSNSKYTLLGATRSVAQTISYEVSIAIIILRTLILSRSINTSSINQENNIWPIILSLPLIIIWFITALAETNRTPFDLAEGESELVSGFNTEYRGVLFALIFIAEYTNILFIRIITAILFLPGQLIIIPSNLWLIFKTITFAILFVWIRGALPRIRYDKLIQLTWKTFLPARLIIIIFTLQLFLISWYCAGRTDNSDDVNYELNSNI